ncbi:hypothetical protein JYU34_022550 [Plutella xylostella]|uniref:Uncharacterized protein n=1 Tax=Plutella xylostella TaxID=51655 RepID=A0ABQ7PQ21_PLUXY|nr:hypothetical protein JYU34_022550 [Plutella xylostella]
MSVGHTVFQEYTVSPMLNLSGGLMVLFIRSLRFFFWSCNNWWTFLFKLSANSFCCIVYLWMATFRLSKLRSLGFLLKCTSNGVLFVIL